jgi:hypothetical protein
MRPDREEGMIDTERQTVTDSMKGVFKADPL